MHRLTGRVEGVHRPLQLPVDVVAHGRVRPAGGVDVPLGQVETGAAAGTGTGSPGRRTARVAVERTREEVVGAAAAVLDVPEPLEHVELGCEGTRLSAGRADARRVGCSGQSGFVACAGREQPEGRSRCPAPCRSASGPPCSRTGSSSGSPARTARTTRSRPDTRRSDGGPGAGRRPRRTGCRSAASVPTTGSSTKRSG